MHVVLLARKTLYTQPGGDTVQVEETAYAQRRCGHEATIITAGQPIPLSATVLHGFNLGRQADLLEVLTMDLGIHPKLHLACLNVLVVCLH